MTIEEVDTLVAELKNAGHIYKRMPQDEFRTLIGEEAYQLICVRDEAQRAEEVAQKTASSSVKHERQLLREAPVAAERERQIREIAASFSGSVSWRQLAILCILPDVAALVRCVRKDNASTKLQVYRKILREEGWTFPVEDMGGRMTIMAAIPPPMTGGDDAITAEDIGDETTHSTDWRGIRRAVSKAQHAQYVRELAEAQQKSNWGIRLPASAR